MNIAVEPARRRHGIGRALMDELLARAGESANYTLEVRVSNVGAIRFYSRYRFSVIDLLRSYYSDGENGYQMAREL